MKTFILDIIPKIERFSKKLDNITVLTNKHWVFLEEELEKKIVYIFREKDNQLLISENGKIEKGTWEYLGNNSLLIDRNDGSFLFRHGFIDDNILALKVDGRNEYALFVNEQKFNDELNSISTINKFLEVNYREEKKHIENSKENKLETKQIYKRKFEPQSFLEIHSELDIISKEFAENPNPNNIEILISYLRFHTIKANLLENNKIICEKILNGKIKINFLEQLFNNQKENIEFISDLEKYVRKRVI